MGVVGGRTLWEGKRDGGLAPGCRWGCAWTMTRFDDEMRA